MNVRTLILVLVFVPTLAFAGLADQLERKHGTGQIRGGNRAWSTTELKILDASLSKLDRQEKRALKGVDIVRMRFSFRPFGAGLYKVDGRGPRILIYDRAFKGPGKGSSKKPNRTIVHEVGHAVAHWNSRRELARANKKVDSANAAVRAYNGEISRYNQLVRRYNNSRSAADKKALDKQRKKVEGKGNDLSRKKTDAVRAKQRVQRTIRQSRPPFVRTGVLAEYRKHLRGRRGPTAYGRRNLSESFAESFSLHHCDPKELKRVLPKVQEWFQKNRHHKAME